jgi:acetylornithine deacetylase
MDTVSPGDISLWKSPPFIGAEEKGKMYGLGASDDKASITTFCLLAKRFIHIKPACDIWLTFVTNEETNSEGTKSFVSYFVPKFIKSYKKIAGIVAEPTGNKFLELGHRGGVKIMITTTGNSGHGSRPREVKQHAVVNMIKIIEKIKLLEYKIQEEYSDAIFGQPSFALTGIASNETSPNKIPNTCSTTWDIRTTPKLHNKLLSLLQNKLGRKVKIEIIGKLSHPPIAIHQDEEIVTIFKIAYPNLILSISPGANDTCKLIDMGIPSVCFGPGIKKSIHKENEYAVIKNIDKSVDIYSKVINLFGKYKYS